MRREDFKEQISEGLLIDRPQLGQLCPTAALIIDFPLAKQFHRVVLLSCLQVIHLGMVW